MARAWLVAKQYRLLEKGIVEAVNQLTKGANQKTRILNFAKSDLMKGKLDHVSAAAKLKETIDEEKVLAKRILRWIDSKENKIAFEILKEMVKVRELNFKDEVLTLEKLCKTDIQRFRGLCECILKQDELVKKAGKCSPEEFIRELDMHLTVQKSVVAQIGKGSDEIAEAVQEIQALIMVYLKRSAGGILLRGFVGGSILPNVVENEVHLVTMGLFSALSIAYGFFRIVKGTEAEKSTAVKKILKLGNAIFGQV